MRAKVMGAARRLGYAPNAIARGLTTRRTRIIGLIMGDMENPFYVDVLNRFSIALQEAQFQLLLFVLPPGQSADEVVTTVLQYQVDAILVTATTVTSEMARVCQAADTPIIMFNRYVSGAKAHVVVGNDYSSSRLIADFLVDNGHSQLAYVAGHANTSTSIDRERGFYSRLMERGITSVPREEGNYSYDGGYKAAMRLLDRRRRPQAIFCANDYMALGVMDAARTGLGLSIPRDVSIVGFDDIPQASWRAYSLTTMRQPVNQMIKATIDILQDIGVLEGPKHANIRLSGQLVLRQSTRPLHGVAKLGAVRSA